MSKIKTKNLKENSIKTLDKTISWLDKVKEPTINTLNTNSNEDINITEYGDRQINNFSNKTTYAAINTTRVSTSKVKELAIKKYKQNKINKKNANNPNVKKIDKGKNKIKTVSSKFKEVKKITGETTKASKRIFEQGKKLAVEGTKKTIHGTKITIKAMISAIKGIIAGVKSLVAMLAAGGTLAIVSVIIICLVGLLVTSMFGIFFSGEKTSKNGITMDNVVIECNQEFGNKLETIQNQTIHDEFILEGSMASWKDILLIYTIKQTNGVNQNEVITIDNDKKKMIKEIFWDMNTITYEVKTENYTSSTVNTSDTIESQQKKVLHIYINSKTADEMKYIYHFNAAQLSQYSELSNNKYDNLWNGAIYGSISSGEYVTWRQKDPKWSNIKIGNSSGTIGSIGCLVTSISILIEKSGVEHNINPLNPGTFVEALNKNNGFDSNGNLQYAAVNKAVPKFKYVGNVNLREKSKEEKLSIIKQYLNSGYYITAEVKGATPGNQHWVAILSADDNGITMVDPGSNHTIMWNAYNYTKTSQFNYFEKKE